MSLVLHGRHLGPLVLADVVSLNGAQPLLAGETTEHKDGTLADGDSVRVTGLGHLSLVEDLVLLRHVDASVLLWRRSTSGDKDLSGRESDGR